MTALVWPLLRGREKTYKHVERAKKALRQRHNRSVLGELSKAASDLATHERAQGNRLKTLQRAVHFACVATHVHAQALAASGELERRPPALIALSGDRGSEIAIASERSLDLIYEGFERWLADRLTTRIEADKPLANGESLGRVETTDGRTIRALLAKIEDVKQRAPDQDTISARYADFTAARGTLGDAPPAKILAHALVDSYTREFDAGPRPFLQGLGRRVGLLFPHFQGRPREKRVRPSVPVLDMLVRACVPAGEALPFDEFLARLWSRFGLIAGGRRGDDWDDAEALARAGFHLDHAALSENTEELIDELCAMGLARRYPDDVTFIGDGHGA